MRAPKQTLLRFARPAQIGGVAMSSSRWKQLLDDAHPTPWPWPDLFLRQGGTALTVGARTPRGAEWLAQQAVHVMTSVAKVAGEVLAVEMLDLSPACADTSYRWQYRVPTWVVAKPGGGSRPASGARAAGTRAMRDWSAWREEQLSREHCTELAREGGEQLARQLAAWDLNPAGAAGLDLRVEHAGRPMVLRDAIAGRQSRPVSVMARLDVVVSSAQRIEGAFFVGHLPTLGYGRLHRDGYLAAA